MGIIVETPFLMISSCLGASFLFPLLDLFVIEVFHFMTMRRFDQMLLLLVLHGHWRVIMTLYLLLVMFYSLVLGHGIAKQICYWVH